MDLRVTDAEARRKYFLETGKFTTPAEMLRAARIFNGLSIYKLADKVGHHFSYMSHLEHGRRRITAEMAKKLEKALDGLVTRADLAPDIFL